MIYKQKVQIKPLLKKIQKLKVFVVGDVMADCYMYGDAHRISPEAPVPIIEVQKKELRPGGAANVAMNCKMLGAQVSLLSIVGKDDKGKELKSILEQNGIEHHLCIENKERITTTKNRVLARNQQVLRIDEEMTTALSVRTENDFIDKCLRAIQIDKPDILIFEDYNKGILSKQVINHILKHCKTVNVFTAVDPKKENFFQYKNVNLFKPNKKEIFDAFQIQPEINKNNLRKLDQLLKKELNNECTMITLSEQGIYAADSHQDVLYNTLVRNIADVSGAGDTVIATAALFYFITKDIALTTHIANIAAGLVCEIPGVVPISAEMLLNNISQ